jgi:hypothetical protein
MRKGNMFYAMPSFFWASGLMRAGLHLGSQTRLTWDSPIS